MMLRLAEIMRSAVEPALDLLPRHMTSAPAKLMLLAIGLQESRFEHRFQLVAGGGKGPARGFWQFEEGTRATRGGVWGVYMHPASMEYLRLLCRARDCEFNPRMIWARIEHDDVLAAGVARLLLWTNARPLPAAGQADAAWDYYLDTWKPGKPHKKTWAPLYQRALEEVFPSTPKGP
jgi:hypothetical protein